MVLKFLMIVLQVFSTLAISHAGDYIDTHMHFVPSRPKKDFTRSADAMIKLMDQYGVAKSIVMPPPTSPDREGSLSYREYLPGIRKYPNRLFLAAGGDNLNPMIMGTPPSVVTAEIKAKFRARAMAILSDGAKAFGEMTALHFSFGEAHPFEQADPDHPLFLLLADIAAEAQVPIDLHMEIIPKDQDLPKGLMGRSSKNPARIRTNLAGFERLLSHNRKAKIVWQHVGWDTTGHLTTKLMQGLLKSHSNLYLAIKYVDPAIESFGQGNRIVDSDMEIQSDWVSLIREFPDRFMVGADEFVWPNESRRTRGAPSFAATWSIIGRLPEDIRTKVGRDNAERIYNLR